VTTAPPVPSRYARHVPSISQVLLDICAAQDLLRAIMEDYNHKNLDTLDEFGASRAAFPTPVQYATP
jgi:hypothetical protein